jgi:hypothetical protein
MGCLKLSYYQTYSNHKGVYSDCVLEPKSAQMWLSVDPMSDKYPSMSPYNYCANNPVIIKDPDGKDIIIYDENNRKVATITKYGTTFEKGMDKNNKAYQNYKASENYLKGKTDVFDLLIKSDSKVNIRMGNSNTATNGKTARQLPNGKMAANEVNIIWDPKSNLVIPQGGENSPAINLFHECIHARNMVSDFKTFQTNHHNTNVPYNYDNMEEYNTIQEVNSVINANFTKWEGVRQDHRGTSGPNNLGVTVPFSVKSKFQPQYSIQDNLKLPR